MSAIVAILAIVFALYRLERDSVRTSSEYIVDDIDIG
jgi:hypothetical protein